MHSFSNISSFLDELNIYGAIYTTIKILIIIILMYLLRKIGNSAIDRFVNKQSSMRFSLNEKRSKTLGAILKSILKYSIYFIGIFIIVEILFGIRGITFASFGGVAIGFGAQNLIKDVINGFFILFEDQYAVGDYVTIEGKAGIVESIELRITRIRDFNGDLHIIPNGAVSNVTNHSRGNVRFLLDISISNDESLDNVMNMIKEICKEFKIENKNVVEGPKVIGVTAMNETSFTIRVAGKAKPLTHWDVEIELREKVMYLLDKQNIKRPYTKMKIIKEEQNG
ncbi:mechanosensitive ion channel family protein [Clostridium peptidivorans]|uniref:mechanosensitive ion channel family protein n=1 Tax=Clostridium peptidivorans TaxID=100174 RepID=UPI001FA92E88|nr:mechanosensitive ion channel family protein [Clostridium peptidivorans]